MKADKLGEILMAVREVYPETLTERQISYLEWLIEQADNICGINIGRAICDYLKIGYKSSRKILYESIAIIIGKD